VLASAGAVAGWLMGLYISGHPLRHELHDGARLAVRYLRLWRMA
jgi:hypothetical protein